MISTAALPGRLNKILIWVLSNKTNSVPASSHCMRLNLSSALLVQTPDQTRLRIIVRPDLIMT